MHIGIPQAIYLVMTFLGVGISIALHGKPRPPHNVIVCVTSSAIAIGLLYWGGFFLVRCGMAKAESLGMTIRDS